VRKETLFYPACIAQWLFSVALNRKSLVRAAGNREFSPVIHRLFTCTYCSSKEVKGKSVPLLLQIILISSLSAFVAYAVARWRQVLPVSRQEKRLTTCETDIADLLSSHQRLLDLVKKLSSRQAVADHRANKGSGAPKASEDIPFGDKAALRARFGAEAAQLARNFKG
jgi:hypothetical protein